MWRDFIALIYPSSCAACQQTLRRGESFLCTGCSIDLPQMRECSLWDNAIHRRFTGRLPVQQGVHRYYFDAGGSVQNLVHAVKYQGQKKLAEAIGQGIGEQLTADPKSAAIDAIIPVPLHKKRLRQRGYNQSEYLAKGIAYILDRPVFTHIVERSQYTKSQTQLDFAARWENVSTCFSIRAADQLAGQHILLVDDVVTSGSTLEACARALLQHTGASISIACMAIAGEV